MEVVRKNLDSALQAPLLAGLNYSDPVSRPAVYFPIPKPSMWVCPEDQADECQNNPETGPDTARFLKSFRIEPDTKHVRGDFEIIADDLLMVAFNNAFTFAASLDDNIDKPLKFKIDDTDNNIHLIKESGTLISQGSFDNILSIGGWNSIQILGLDGYFADDPLAPTNCPQIVDIPNSNGKQWCVTNRLNSYVYVKGAIETIPEPSTIFLFAVALSGLIVLRRYQV